MPTLLVFGARNLGRVLARELAADGWHVAAVARTDDTIVQRPDGKKLRCKVVRETPGGAAYRDAKDKEHLIPWDAVERIEYDPNRTSRIALLHYLDGEKRYIIAPVGLKVGDQVVAGPEADIKPGNALPLKNIPTGTTIHNIELTRGRGGQMVRGAGAGAQLMAKEGDYALVRLPSGEQRRVHILCTATIGQVGNIDHENQSIGKAGRSRHMGRRPTVRGSVMNPRDHPHGGGEGRAPIGGQPQTPWGKPALGYKTRNNKRTDQFIVRRRNASRRK